MSVEEVYKLLSSQRFSLDSEKSTQDEIEKLLRSKGVRFFREYKLDIKNRPDFFIDGICIEVKIKGSAKAIYRQCERYSVFENVKQIILITNRAMGFPTELNNKPCYVIKMSKQWL